MYSRSTIVTQQHVNSGGGVYGGRGTGGYTTAGGTTGGGSDDTNSVISSVTIDDNMELLEPLPIFPNIFDESDDDDECTRLGLRGRGDEQGGHRAQAQEEAGSNDDDSNMPTRIPINAHAGIVSRTSEVYQSAGIVRGRSKEDMPPPPRSGGNDNNGCTTVCPAVSQGQEAMLSWQMNHQYQMMGVVQPTLNHQLPHNFLHLPHHNNNNMYHHHVPSSHCNNMQAAQQNQLVGSSVMMPPPLYSYPRPPSYQNDTVVNTNNGSTSITTNNNSNRLSSTPEKSDRMRVDDAIENDLMKLVPPGAAGNSAAILLGGDSTTASVESDRFNLDDFLERIFNEYE